MSDDRGICRRAISHTEVATHLVARRDTYSSSRIHNAQILAVIISARAGVRVR
jgi:hypothetical protein